MSTKRLQLIKHLHILKGQLEGIEKLISSEAPCEKVLTQFKALRSNLLSCTRSYLESHYCTSCQTLTPKHLSEILTLLSRY